MKTHIYKLTVLASLILSVASQAATPTTELKVKGKIGVPSCTVIAPNNGVYDMGRLSATNVKAGTTVTVLPEMKKNWTITCDSTTYLSLSSVDNRLASVSDTTSTRNYGLGNINRTGKIGFYTVILSNASVDGTSTSMYYRVGTGAATLGTSLYLVNGYTYGWSNSTSTANFGKTFSADIAVTPTLAGTSTMNGPITEDSNIDGSLTMNFSFGI
ncbi:fimbrial assembly protein [Yersinia frederiksenii]|nr:fimbrial assembly protein [Yersinia frederiksenii]